MSAEVVSASWAKAAHCCLTSCSGTHRVERVERSGKEEAGRAHEAGTVSCCSCGCGRRCGKVVVMRRRLLSVERARSHRPCGGIHVAHSKACLLHAHTLEGFALDDERCLLGRDEALLNSLMHLGNQRRVFATGTTRVTTKGAFCGMDDGVFHQDEKGLVWFPHRVSPLHVLDSRPFSQTYYLRGSRSA